MNEDLNADFIELFLAEIVVISERLKIQRLFNKGILEHSALSVIKWLLIF